MVVDWAIGVVGALFNGCCGVVGLVGDADGNEGVVFSVSRPGVGTGVLLYKAVDRQGPFVRSPAIPVEASAVPLEVAAGGCAASSAAVALAESECRR